MLKMPDGMDVCKNVDRDNLVAKKLLVWSKCWCGEEDAKPAENQDGRMHRNDDDEFHIDAAMAIGFNL